MKSTVFVAAALAAGAACAISAHAGVIASWTFETSAPVTAGPHTAEGGANAASSFASGFHAGTSTYSSPVGNGSARSFSSNGWAVGDYYQFVTSTLGYHSISIGWDHTSSNTGPRDFILYYSVDSGATFTALTGTLAVLANASPNPTWSSTTNHPIFAIGPFAGPAALDNQASVIFRMVQSSTVSANGGTVASTGTSRVDNVTIEGTLIPSPGALALLGMAGLVARRRR